MDTNTELQQLLLERIGLDPHRTILFEDLPEVMTAFALHIPFENSDVIGHQPSGISKEYLIQKVIKSNRGGLCYHLNRLFYLFLVDCGFNVTQHVGTVWNQQTLDKWAPNNGHIITVLHKENDGATSDFLIDVGFGLFLALKPIPLGGQEVTSRTGSYRWNVQQTEKGTHLLEAKNPNDQWRLGYAFSTDIIATEQTINTTQRLIHEDELETFNVNHLTCLLLAPEVGQAVLTGDSFTITNPSGEKDKKSVTPDERLELLKTVYKFK
ncbi:hypothetical protein SAMD00019534_118470 [Acytostelium subglobosum LB1]|uniref:hypothetical protein n=1 Tax=Acytostelium subglobosum LB1 TaxID=1410327 RepID=UPI0006449E68|nr:hypothetical protein SAMD00019534_118470 [Acytostelium subglobosum LB1]GAM28671.1 hypothetical protein SAMD00019534_118470 [Acytostelium subglobosum LB1]|eukprot:XP_012748449.1 hypothetical protein SAMD00019534_118470 [Acytostelium subglobosum LB1]